MDVRGLHRFAPTVFSLGLVGALAAWGFHALHAAQPAAPARPPGPLSFFVGSWRGEGTRGDGKRFKLSYDVRVELPGSWLSGRAREDADGEEPVEAADLWGVSSSGRLERFVAMGTGAHGVVSGRGWDGHRLVLEGAVQAGGTAIPVRETIERLSDHRFRAVWEAKAGEAWTLSSEEVLHRLPP